MGNECECRSFVLYCRHTFIHIHLIKRWCFLQSRRSIVIVFSLVYGWISSIVWFHGDLETSDQGSPYYWELYQPNLYRTNRCSASPSMTLYPNSFISPQPITYNPLLIFYMTPFGCSFIIFNKSTPKSIGPHLNHPIWVFSLILSLI